MIPVESEAGRLTMLQFLCHLILETRNIHQKNSGSLVIR
ncbi:MAG TPA: hypothetical protein EYQ14_06770 [Gammaproteobacteria bacterium]|nr:hypothetical protein [Gammaproteobacteria bacterium]HIL71952.1 hypothetical protein [Verrucomicrobiota bacterium]